MRTNERALSVYRLRLWAGRTALLIFISTVLFMACNFGRTFEPRLAPHESVNEVMEVANWSGAR